jgi:hypothetical protein
MDLRRVCERSSAAERLAAFVSGWYGVDLPDDVHASEAPPLLARLQELNRRHKVMG